MVKHINKHSEHRRFRCVIAKSLCQQAVEARQSGIAHKIHYVNWCLYEHISFNKVNYFQVVPVPPKNVVATKSITPCQNFCAENSTIRDRYNSLHLLESPRNV